MFHPTKGRRLPPEPLGTDEVRRLVASCSTRAPTGVRNKALIVVLWRAGLRIGEALGLRVADVDGSHGTIRILHGKGDKSRLVGLDLEAIAVLQEWLDLRAELGVHSPWVFSTLQGNRLQTSYVRNLLPRLARLAGVEKRVHAHGLRHTHAVELRREGVDLAVISRQLGHASVATTDRYLNHLSPEMVIATIHSRPGWAG